MKKDTLHATGLSIYPATNNDFPYNPLMGQEKGVARLYHNGARVKKNIVVILATIVVEYTTLNMLLDKLFGSKLRAKVLSWLFTHSDESFSVRQLATILKVDPTNLSRELSLLASIGILKYSRMGNLKQYRVDPEISFFSELKNLVLKTVGIAGRIKTSLSRINGLSLAFIYGSFAQGQEKADSDIDLFLVGNIELDELDKTLSDLERDLGRAVHYVVFDREELALKRRKRDGFVLDVLKGPKIWLLGEENEYQEV